MDFMMKYPTDTSLICPPIPLRKSVNLLPGDLLLIKGRIPSISACAARISSRFEINLLDRAFPMEERNVVLHVNARPDYAEPGVVVNSRLFGRWGEELTSKQAPPRLGCPFSCALLVHRDHYKIAFNEIHIMTFTHRASYMDVNWIEVRGNVEVTKLSVTKNASLAALSSITFSPVIRVMNPVTPCAVHVGDAVEQGHLFFISVEPRISARSFEINFEICRQDRTDIAFHLNPRFTSWCNPEIVCNSYFGDWGTEESYYKDDVFPFKEGISYLIIIQYEHSFFKVSVDGEHLFNFKARHQQQDVITQVTIEGETDVNEFAIYPESKKKTSLLPPS